jgi:hypothetical protein
MGTRSKTFFHFDNSTVKDPNDSKLILYRQYDGYPDGHGLDLAEACLNSDGEELQLVNGYNNKNTQANGMGCLAATIVSKLKDGCGNIYLEDGDSNDLGWLDYYYTVSPSKGSCG